MFGKWRDSNNNNNLTRYPLTSFKFIDQIKITKRKNAAGAVETNDSVSTPKTSWKDTFTIENGPTTNERKSEETESGNILSYARLDHVEENKMIRLLAWSYLEHISCSFMKETDI